MTRTKVELGATGETLAVKYLQRLGYTIIEQNFRVRYGEIDIIAEQDGTLVFIEVRTRTGKRYGVPFDSITATKQNHLSKAALEYMSRNNCHHRAARFDVISVQFTGGEPGKLSDARIEIIKNAFDLCYGT